MTGCRNMDDLSKARRIGAAASGYPRSVRAPGVDASLLRLIGDVPVGQPRTIELMTAWMAGWDAVHAVAETTGVMPRLAERIRIAETLKEEA